MGFARIAIVVGGTFSEMLGFSKALAADAILWVDVLSELVKLQDKVPNGVFRLPLGAGHTLASLFEQAPNTPHFRKLRDYLQKHAGVDINGGLAQRIFAGLRAAQLLVDSPDFAAMLEKMYSQVLTAHNGTIERVNISLYASTCGGTGGPAGSPILDRIAEYYREHHRAVVSVEKFRCGSLSYESLGESVHLNRAAIVLQDLASTLLEKRPLNETRSLNFFELPMVAGDKYARDQYMIGLLQAVCSDGYQNVTGTTAPNLAAHHPLGSIKLFNVGWWRQLPPAHICCEVAHSYLAAIKTALAFQPTSSNAKFHVELSTLPPVCEESVPQLLGRVQHAKACPVGWQEMLENISCGPSATVSVETKPSVVHFASWYKSHFATAPDASLEAFRRRLAELRDVRQLIKQGMAGFTSRKTELTQQRSDLRNQFAALLREFYPQDWSGKILNWIFSSRQKERARRFHNLAQQLRTLVLQIEQQDAQIAALSACESQIQAAMVAIETQLQAVGQLLQNACSELQAPECPYVTPQPCEAVFPDLLRLSCCLTDATVEPAVQRLLENSAKALTLAGLSCITGAAQPRIELVARQLVAEPLITGPYWGGQRPVNIDTTCVVVPPVGSELKSALLSQVSALGKSKQFHLLFLQEAASWNAVRIQIRSPKSTSELVTPMIEDEIQDLLHNPELFFPPDFETDDLKPLVNGHADHQWEPVSQQ